MEYSLDTTENGVTTLKRNGIECHCPFQQEDVRCGSWCALFFIKKNAQGANINLGCTQAPTIYIND